MRTLCGVVILLVGLCAAIQLPPTDVSSQDSSVQSLFLGDRDCPDVGTECNFPGIVPAHRYLHVIVHDAPGNSDWRVDVASRCADAPARVAGGQTLDEAGYIEVVVDITAVVAGMQVGTSGLCIGFHGGNHYWVTYYAAYFDDSPTPDGDVVYPSYRTVLGRPDLPDLDVTYISRGPVYAYDSSKNTPSVGDIVTYHAHVRNSGLQPSAAFTYRWSLDGRIVGEGEEAGILIPGADTTYSYSATWTGVPQTLTFALTPSATETSQRNNTLSIDTTALTLGFWIERSAYIYFGEHQNLYCSLLTCAGSNSFEDWLQRQVAAWNQLLQQSRSVMAPTGVADRIRVDKIVVVPDGSLPLHGGLATNDPDLQDHSVDLEWGLPASNIDRAYPHRWDGPFDVDWSLMHELGHARSLADLYRFDIPLSASTSIAVTGSDGKPVFDPSRPLDTSMKLHGFVVGKSDDFLYVNKEQDLMSCPCTPMYSPYSVLVLNRLRGRRAVCGNTNPPCNLGDWFSDIPAVNTLTVEGGDGHKLLPGAEVRLYHDTSTGYTGHSFDSAHSEVMAVINGQIQLGPDPFHAVGSAQLGGHNLLLIEVRAPGLDTFCFQEPTDFNIAFWEGYRAVSHPARYILRTSSDVHNRCNLTGPRPRVNEPFATSPVTSHVHLGSPLRGNTDRQSARVQLLDDASPPNPMRNRLIRVRGNAGRIQATCTTEMDGACSVTVPILARGLHIDDVTDNHLFIPWASQVSPPIQAQRQ